MSLLRQPPERLVVAVGAASGAAYARLLLEAVVPVVPEVAVVLSRTAPTVIAAELDLPHDDLLADLPPAVGQVTRWAGDDYNAPFASGSNAYDAMVVVPASGGLLGRLAAGVSDSLITRAADVCLKERRPLILVPRETPLNTIHLRNQLLLAEAGALILPASPSFYQRPQTVREVLLTVVDRILDHLALPRPNSPRWAEDSD